MWFERISSVFNFYKNVFGITSSYALLYSPSLNKVHTHIYTNNTELILLGFQFQ